MRKKDWDNKTGKIDPETGRPIRLINKPNADGSFGFTKVEKVRKRIVCSHEMLRESKKIQKSIIEAKADTGLELQKRMVEEAKVAKARAMAEFEARGMAEVMKARERLNGMLSKSVDAVQEIVESGGDPVRLKAAIWNCEVLGISRVNRSEVVSRDGDMEEKAALIEGLKEELRRQIRGDECEGDTGVIVIDKG